MTTLHLQTEIAHQAAQNLTQSALAMDSEIRSLHRALWLLEENWQGGTQEEFATEASLLFRNFRTESEFILTLVARLKREIQEWEQADQLNAENWLPQFREGPFWGSPTMPYPYLPSSAGEGNSGISLLFAPPMSVALSIGSFLSGIPAWLENIFDDLFPQPVATPSSQTASPSPENQHSSKTALGELLEETPQETMGEEILQDIEKTPKAPTEKETSPYLLNYDVPVKSQGELYGSAACTPTSVSMVLDYFHNQNPENQTISPQRLIEIMDKGDGTYGKGISISNLTDELNALGYQHITPKMNADFSNLQSVLSEGPTIAITGVHITSGSAGRALDGPGSTMHAMVLRGLSEKTVSINDPWSGKNIEIPIETFSEMWKRGSNSYYAIRP